MIRCDRRPRGVIRDAARRATTRSGNSWKCGHMKLGIAGVNTRPLMRAADPLLGIAGNWGSTLRPHVERILAPPPPISRQRLGEQAALHAWKHACYFLDYTYLACP